MKNDHQSYRVRTINDLSYDLLGRMLIERETRQFQNELNAGTDTEEAECREHFFCTHQNEHLSLIKKQIHRGQIRKALYITAPKLGRILAVIIVMLGLVSGVAVASSSTVRVKIMKMLQDVTPEYTRITFVEDEDLSIDVPAQWSGEYYPFVLPDGCQLQSLDGDTVFSVAEFARSNVKVWEVSYREYNSANAVQIDTEDAVIGSIQLQDKLITFVLKDNLSCAYWDDDHRLCLLYVRGYSMDEFIAIAAGVKKLK